MIRSQNPFGLDFTSYQAAQKKPLAGSTAPTNPYQVKPMSGTQPAQTAPSQGTTIMMGGQPLTIPAINAGDMSLSSGRGMLHYRNPDMQETPSWSLQNAGSYFPQWSNGLRADNFDFDYGGKNNWALDAPDGQTNYLRVKTDEKEGTLVPFSLVDGQWQPKSDGMQKTHWDTNTGWTDFRDQAVDVGKVAAAIAAAVTGGNYLAQLNAGSTAGTVGAEAAAGWGGAEELFLANPALGPGAQAGIGEAATSLGGVGGLAGGGESLAGLTQLGIPGTDVGLGEIAQTGLTEPTSWDRVTSGVQNYLRGGRTVSNLLNGNSGGQGGGGMDIGSLLAAYYGSQARNNTGKDMMTLYNDMKGQAQPLIDQLNSSYTNPNAYFNSPDVKARLELEADRLTRGDAAGGRLSNDIGRDQLLQKYAAQDIGNYRNSLNQSISQLYQPNILSNLYLSSSLADNTRYAPFAGAIGQHGGFSVGDIVQGGQDLWETGKDIWDTVSGWF